MTDDETPKDAAPSDPTESKDPKVKDLVDRDRGQALEELVDPETAAQLERWFGLPSFAQVEAGEVVLADKPVSEDPSVVAVRAKRIKIANEEVDKVLLANIERRIAPADYLLQFRPSIEYFDPTMAMIDLSSIPGAGTDDEERAYPVPEYLEDILKENAPQALLRDLHRPEFDFDAKSDEFVNEDEDEEPVEPPFDLRATIKAALDFRPHFTPIEIIQINTLMADAHNEIRRQAWPDLPKRARLVNRRIEE